jgi:hypothetical protein
VEGRGRSKIAPKQRGIEKNSKKPWGEVAMLKKLLPLILLVSALCAAQLIDDDVMPFGGYLSKHADKPFYDNEELDRIHDTLGLNQWMSCGFDSLTVYRFYSKGVFPYDACAIDTGMPWDVKPPNMYAHTTYFLCQPESTEYYHVTFNTVNGQVQDDSLWTIDYADTMLGELILALSSTPEWPNADPICLMHYLYLKIGIDTTNAADTVPVGVFKV